MDGNYGHNNDNALLNLLGEARLLNSSPRSNSSGSRHLSPSDNSPLMRYLLSGTIASGSPLPMSRLFYNSNGSGGSSSGSGGISSSSPFSAIENKERLPLAAQLSPEMKIEEDVLVMDEILVEPVKHGASKLRSSATSSDSGGSYSSAFPSPGSFYKTEMCRAWEVLGACQFGPKCQFAHGKEELRPTCLPNKSYAEQLMTGKSYSSPELYVHGPRHHLAHKGSTTGPPREALVVMTVSTSATPPRVKPNHHEGVMIAAKSCTPSPMTPQRTVVMMLNTPSPVTPEYTVASISPVSTITSEWSPLDDGIEVELMNSVGNLSSREAVDEYIKSILYGRTGKKRLPAFVDICRE